MGNVKHRTKIYKGICPICTKVDTLVRVSYNSLTLRLEYSYECLKCGNAQDIELDEIDKAIYLKDIKDWLDRLNFIGTISPKMLAILWQQADKSN